MRTFLVGLLLGAASGGGTACCTGDRLLAVIAGLVAAGATWLGSAALVIWDD
ncbi:hypothetical protein ABZ352_18410 [Streptomyces griseofuscus]|uniref:hypothetical protein n=1 Tax=Streptomyces griseofuscus TaxID=146922 RepID=UPI0033D78E44